MKDQEELSGLGESKPTRAIRLTFSYEGSKIQLIARQHVEMLAPPSEALTHLKKASGFWIQIEDENRKPIYRKFMQDPIQHAVEVRSDDPKRPLMWQEVEKPKGIFTVVIPEMKAARDIVLHGSRRGVKAARESASEEIGRFSLGPGHNKEVR